MEKKKSEVDNKFHSCDYEMLDIEYKDFKKLYGVAIFECFENGDGELIVTNDEYGNRVNYCPYCGYKAKNQMKLKEKKIIS